jgi:Cys-tRNA(Pro) deacylase
MNTSEDENSKNERRAYYFNYMAYSLFSVLILGVCSVMLVFNNTDLKVTGYIRGGCSPIGMKKDYKTVLDSSCKDLDTFIISAGKIGHQIEVCPKDLEGFINCKIEHVTM